MKDKCVSQAPDILIILEVKFTTLASGLLGPEEATPDSNYMDSTTLL
jgi:hypothetical protein